MNYEKLTSDKVNYLIWRYLQEAGFGQAAARLQHDWGLQHHPDDLPFAKYIGPRGLITLIQYGLKLHRIQAQDRPKQQPRFFGPDPGTTDATADAPASRTKSTSPPRRFDQTSALSTPLSTSKPRGRRPNGGIAGVNGKPRGSLTSVSENMEVDQAVGIATKSENQMDIDDDDSAAGNDNKAADETHSSLSSPTRNGEQAAAAMNGLEMRSQQQRPNQEQQAVPTSVPVINRMSTATQVDDIIELAPRTTTINTNSIKENNIVHVSLSSARPSASTSWLAVGGSHSGQIWEIAKDSFGQATLTLATQDYQSTTSNRVVRPRYIIELDIEPASSLTSLAWSPDGTRLAFSSCADVASEADRSVIKIVAPSEGKVQETCCITPDTISNLVWDTDGRCIAGLSSTSVLVVDTNDGDQSKSVDTGRILMDLVWKDTETLAVCGSSYIATVAVSELNLEVKHQFSDLPEAVEWTTLRYDPMTRSLAAAAETSGELAVIDNSDRVHCKVAHSAGITALVDRPRSGEEAQGTRILATSSSDGHVKIWRFDSQITLVQVTLLQTLEMGGISQALTMSFSPSADVLAVADLDKILFWHAGSGAQPRYKWELRRVDWHSPQVNGYTTNGVNGQDHEIDMNGTFDLPPLLMWNEADHSLIFAHQEKIAIIDTPE